jgi:integrase
MAASTNGRVTGHVKLRRGERGAVWYARYRLPDGRQRQRRLGDAWEEPGRPPDGQYTRRTANEALQEILTKARRGELAGQRATGATFADASAEFLRYCEQERQIDPDTVDDYRGVIDGYLDPEFGERALESIDADDVDGYKGRLLAEGRLTPRTIVRHLVVLHGIFKRAARVYRLETNPAAADLVQRPKIVYSGEFDTYTGEEVELLAAHAPSRLEAALYRTAAMTGLRLGELLALRWRDVDFVSGLLHVRKNFVNGREKVPKGKRVRSVPMMAQVVDGLALERERDHWIGDDDLVFCSSLGGHMDGWRLRRRFYGAIASAGLRRIRFHDLRHCFGTTAIRVLDPLAVQGYMGHAHYSTTSRYLHHQPRPQDARALERAFGGARDDPRAEASRQPAARCGSQRLVTPLTLTVGELQDSRAPDR